MGEPLPSTALNFVDSRRRWGPPINLDILKKSLSNGKFISREYVIKNPQQPENYHNFENFSNDFSLSAVPVMIPLRALIDDISCMQNENLE